tara:strand:- start:1826 stop:2179 length:354 start_codon:yes stop_codon:yes gene_type:complete
MNRIAIVILSLLPWLLSAKVSDAELKKIASGINQELQQIGISSKAISCRIYNHTNPKIVVFEYSGSLMNGQNAAMMADKFKNDFTKNWTAAESKAFKKEGYEFIQFKVKNKTTNFTL